MNLPTNTLVAESTERCKASKSCLIRFSQVIFGLPLLLIPSTMSVSTILIVSVVCLLLKKKKIFLPPFC
ncbi:hypothetical protein Hanom_Chr10g00911611 [Helianthus anomalus]